MTFFHRRAGSNAVSFPFEQEDLLPRHSSLSPPSGNLEPVSSPGSPASFPQSRLSNPGLLPRPFGSLQHASPAGLPPTSPAGRLRHHRSLSAVDLTDPSLLAKEPSLSRYSTTSHVHGAAPAAAAATHSNGSSPPPGHAQQQSNLATTSFRRSAAGSENGSFSNGRGRHDDDAAAALLGNGARKLPPSATAAAAPASPVKTALRSMTSKRRDDYDEDEKETFGDRLKAHPTMIRLDRSIDRLMMSQPVAILIDVLDVALFCLDIYTDIKVIMAFSEAGNTTFLALTLSYFLLHHVLMALLMCWYAKRTASVRWSLLGWSDEDLRQGDWRWLAFVPVAVPSVLLLDLAMLFISLLPCMVKGSTAISGLSSFLSNYKFSRMFIKFWAKSIPQTVCQTLIYVRLQHRHAANTASKQAIARSLAVSCINVIKFGWFLYKAADDAGMRLSEYWKYLALLKGNYDCAPAAMSAMIAECCSLRGDTFLMNGFALHRDKSRYGPAQQSYILLNAFERFEGRASQVRKWTLSGCPVASINRIMEKGIKTFRRLETLEVKECALRGDPSFRLVTRAIKRHRCLGKVKIIQTGMLKKYRNQMVEKATRGLFKRTLGLRQLALCAPWWDEERMLEAAQALRGHPTLELLAIEFPATAATTHTSSSGVVEVDVGAEFGGLSVAIKVDAPGAGGACSLKYGWALVTVLHALPHLHSLLLHNHSFAEDSIGVIAKALESNSGLTLLSLRGSKVGDSGAVALAKTLLSNRTLTSLSLRHCQLHAEGIAALGGSLVENRTLQCLDISHNRVHADGLRQLARSLRLNAGLTALRIEGWKDTFDDEQALSALAAAMAANRCLRSLHLAGSELRSRGAAALAGGLAFNAALQVLDLSCGDKAAPESRVGDAGLEALAAALARHPALTELHLQGNVMGAASMLGLCQALHSNRSLTSLDVSRCGLGDGHVADLLLALLGAAPASGGVLQRLGLGGVSGLGMRAMQALGSVLRSHECGLEWLDLSFMTLETRDHSEVLAVWSALANSLAATKYLTHLDISFCSLTQTAAEALALAFSQNSSLTSVNVCGYSEVMARRTFAGVSACAPGLLSLLATSDVHGPINILEHSGPDDTWAMLPPAADDELPDDDVAATPASDCEAGRAEPAAAPGGGEPRATRGSVWGFLAGWLPHRSCHMQADACTLGVVS